MYNNIMVGLVTGVLIMSCGGGGLFVYLRTIDDIFME